MRALSIILGFGLVVATSTSMATTSRKAHSKHASTKAKHAKAQKPAGGDLKTDVSFDDSVLHGQYQTPDEALAKVENEKGFGDLVGVRKHFKDRLTQASEQE